jgi:hypothetical protein
MLAEEIRDKCEISLPLILHSHLYTIALPSVPIYTYIKL